MQMLTRSTTSMQARIHSSSCARPGRGPRTACDRAVRRPRGGPRPAAARASRPSLHFFRQGRTRTQFASPVPEACRRLAPAASRTAGLAAPSSSRRSITPRRRRLASSASPPASVGRGAHSSGSACMSWKLAVAVQLPADVAHEPAVCRAGRRPSRGASRARRGAAGRSSGRRSSPPRAASRRRRRRRSAGRRRS